MIKKEITVVRDTYTDRNGQERKSWLKVGEIHEHNGREYVVLFPWINLAAIPKKEGDNRVFANLFDPKQDEVLPKSGNARLDAQQQDAFEDDDIPF